MNSSAQSRRLVVGISGASGIIYGIELLKALRVLGVESHLVVSKSARLTLQQESSLSYADLLALADRHYPNTDVGAAIASGSFRTLGMVVAPCSVRSLGEIASGITSSLLSRAADVTLKERRKLILVVRETPLSVIHLENMLRLARAGAVILPANPGFYYRPATVAELVDFIVARILDQLEIPHPLPNRPTMASTTWSGSRGMRDNRR